MDTPTPNSALFHGLRSCLSFVVVGLFAALALVVYLDTPRDISPETARAVLLPTVTPTPLPTSTPDPDTAYFAALGDWGADVTAWIGRWEPLLNLPAGSAEWNDGWAAVVRDGNTLAGRLHLLPVHAGRTNLHGLAESTFESCLRAAQAFSEGDVYGGKLYMSLCTTGSTLLADKIRAER